MASKTSIDETNVAIIGAGHAGGRAAQQLRAFGFDGTITLMGSEPIAPYERPPLSKGVLLDEGAEKDTLLFDPSWYADNGITLRTSTDVTKIDRQDRLLTLSGGGWLRYEKAIIATGGRLRRLPVPGADLDDVLYLKTMHDALALRARLKPQTRLVVVGGGFIGLEVAASARAVSADVTVVETQERLMGRAVPPAVSEVFKDIHTDWGTDIVLGQAVASIQPNGADKIVVMQDGRQLPADTVVIGIGIVPDTLLAEAAGLEVDNGIVVNQHCQSSDPSIFAIGDVASQVDPNSGKCIRIESWQNAESQAARVAASIAGEAAPDAEPLWFWSDQHDVNLQIVGCPPDWDDLIIRGASHREPLMFFKMHDDVVQGVIGLNAKRDMLLMRKLMAAGKPIDRDILTNTQVPLKKTVLNAIRT